MMNATANTMDDITDAEMLKFRSVTQEGKIDIHR